MATMVVADIAGDPETIEKPLPPGQAAAINSRPVALSNENVAQVGATNETAPSTDVAASGLNGRLQRLAQHLTISLSQLGATNETAAAGDTTSGVGLNGRLQRIAQNITTSLTQLGIVTETAPANDTASSGINGRLQRVAQNVTTSLTHLGATTETAAAGDTTSGVGLNGRLQRVAQNLTSHNALFGATAETAPGTDTATSGLNGRLQRVAQNLTSHNALFGATNETAAASDTATAGLNGRLQRVAQNITTSITHLSTLAGTVSAARMAVNLISGQVGIAAGTGTDGATVPRVTLATNVGLPAGEAFLGKTGGSSPVKPIVMSCHTSAMTANAVIADTQQLDAALRVTNGTGLLQSIVVQDKDDQKAALKIVVLDANVSLGTEGSAATITDANSDNILGFIDVAVADYADLGGMSIACPAFKPFNVQAVAATDDLYLAVLNGAGTPTFTASGIRLRLGILQD